MRIRLTQGLEQEMSLKVEQAIKIEIRQAQTFGEFISKAKAVCPNCGHKLTDDEIIKGFSEDPIDFSTTCPKCSEKFLANLIIEFKDDEKKVEQVIYLCPVQTLDQMKNVKMKRGQIGLVWLSKYNRPLFFNIIRHWGTYNKGLKALKTYNP